jgi:tetratricopeptide (TPR) repeat protein
MICKYCGADNNENRKICKGCGNPLYEYEEVQPFPKKKKNILLYVCISAGTVAVLAIVLASVLLYQKTSLNGKYASKVTDAEKYIAQLDYDTAITLCNEAIELEPDNPKGYIQLVNVYITMNEIAKAQEIALKGFGITQDSVLQDLVNVLFNVDNTDTGADGLQVLVNSSFLTNVSQESYSNITQGYGSGQVSIENGYTKVLFSSFNGALYYGASSVDANTGQPLENAMPEYIVLFDLSPLITNFNGYLSNATLAEIFKSTIQIEVVDGIQCAVLEYMKCSIAVQCDSEGNISTAQPYVKIMLLGNDYDADLNALKGTATGKITESSTGNGIANAHLVVYEGSEVKKGTVVAETDTDSTGSYTLNLKEGRYTICASKTGYTESYFNVTVNKGMTTSGQNFAMDKTGDTGTSDIKLVVEWNSTLEDVDLHVQGQTPNRQYISVYGYGGTNMTASENGKVVAKLEENVKTSNGSETIIIDSSIAGGTYAVHVHDQINRSHNTAVKALSNAAVVLKVYLPGETTPHVYNIPTDTEGNCWYPCNIVNGTITIPASSSQMRYSTIG